MIDINDVCILLTGCIHPALNVMKLSLKSPEERTSQTLKSIDFFIRHSKIKKIVYCDSSLSEKNDKLNELACKYNKEFEWVSFQGDTTKTAVKGKGYGEGETIEYAISNSQLIKKSKVIIKVTGRLYVKNINSILLLLDNRYSYLDYHNKYVDTRCYIVQKSDYINFLLHAHQSVNDNQRRYIENVFYDIAKTYDGVFHPFPVACNIIGMSGSTGESYGDSSIKHLLKSVKIFLRAVVWHIKRYRKSR